MSYVPWPLYRRIIQHVPIACVDVAIIRDGQVLLVRRNNEPAKGQLWLPGGRVHKGEMLRQAAARKALEETGISCYVGPIIYTAETIFEDGPNGIPVHSINCCFLLTPRHGEGEVQPDDQHTDWVWVDAIQVAWHPYVKNCLAAAGLA